MHGCFFCFVLSACFSCPACFFGFLFCVFFLCFSEKQMFLLQIKISTKEPRVSE